ncbi:MAG: NTP transferase domain-containing protein [Acidobacteriota bacterium]
MTYFTRHGPRCPGAVVLAAGDSRRMGRHKALLSTPKGTFLDVWVARLRAAGIMKICVVLGRNRAAVEARLDLPAGMVVENRSPEEGMLSSFLAGLEHLPGDLPGVFLCPVDHPEVLVTTLVKLKSRLAPGKIVVPVHRGRRGHPVLFAAELLGELRRAPANQGARAVVRAVPARVIECPAGPGVLRDVDTPADYRRFMAAVPRT